LNSNEFPSKDENKEKRRPRRRGGRSRKPSDPSALNPPVKKIGSGPKEPSPPSQKDRPRALSPVSSPEKKKRDSRPRAEGENRPFKPRRPVGEKDRAGDFKNNNYKNDRNRNRKQIKKRPPIPPFERRQFDLQLVCAGCSKPITDPFSAFISPDNVSEAYHFDCAVERLKQREVLAEGESIIYIGSGNFAVAKIKREARNKTSFEIIRKIEFEPKKEDMNSVAWRKILRQS
jgi:hypothetical protein